MKNLYTAHAKVVGGREGTAETDDKQLSLTFATPGSGKAGTNPEQLFACGYAACFGSAIAAVARKQNTNVGQITVQSDVALNQDDSGYFLGVMLNVTLEVDQATAETIVAEAHKMCPYSKATKGNIDVTLKANGQQLKRVA